jgi:hypothetical protein
VGFLGYCHGRRDSAHARRSARCSTKQSRQRSCGNGKCVSWPHPIHGSPAEDLTSQTWLHQRINFANNSPLHSTSLAYPLHTQDAAAPPKRVVVGRTVALRLRLRMCLTLVSKKQVKPSSGRRQGSIFTSILTTALCLSRLPIAHPRRRCSTETSRRRAHGSATAPPLSVPNTGQQEAGSTQLGATAREHFHLNSHHCPLLLLPTHCTPKTPRLHQNESSSGAR